MKYSPCFKSLLNCDDSQQVFAYLTGTLNDSITYWNYFVNWEKVLGNIKDLEVDLNTLNYLVGKENVFDEFRYLLQKQPSLARLIPVLLACRDCDFKILVNYSSGDLKYEKFSFGKNGCTTPEEIEKACKFAQETGLLKMFGKKQIKSVPDYAIGVEVGLDSNARKNRGGTAMENIVENLLETLCQEHGFGFMKQATAEKISAKWHIKLRVDKSSRRFDFAVNTKSKLFLVETNYYGGGGSKLKATAGEYHSLFDFISEQGHEFIWITDGLGWKSTLRPLEEAFNHIDYTLNLNMVSAGILSCILSE